MNAKLKRWERKFGAAGLAAAALYLVWRASTATWLRRIVSGCLLAVACLAFAGFAQRGGYVRGCYIRPDQTPCLTILSGDDLLSFEIIDIGAPRGDTWSAALAIGSGGEVVGVAGEPSKLAHPLAWKDGRVRSLSELPGYATAVNAEGKAAGYAIFKDRSIRAAYFDGKKSVSLGTLPKMGMSQATGINDRGQVVGVAFPVKEAGIRSFIWSEGRMEELKTPAGGVFSMAAGINNAGTAVGYAHFPTGGGGDRVRAVAWDSPTRIRDLGTIGNGDSFATAVNARGDAVGGVVVERRDGNAEVAPVLFSGGKVTRLPMPGGFHSAMATAMNDRGDAVGMAWKAGEMRPILWKDGRVEDLRGGSGGWMLLDARGINNAGQIAGYGILKRELRGFVLSPR
jgi:hypothetical protein